MFNLKLAYFLSIPKSFFFNMRCFPLKTAIHFPCLIHYNTKLIGLRKNAIHLTKVEPAVIKYGFGGTFGIQPEGAKKNYFQLDADANVHFGGTAVFCQGTTIRLAHGGGIDFWR